MTTKAAIRLSQGSVFDMYSKVQRVFTHIDLGIARMHDESLKAVLDVKSAYHESIGASESDFLKGQDLRTSV